MNLDILETQRILQSSGALLLHKPKANIPFFSAGLAIHFPMPEKAVSVTEFLHKQKKKNYIWCRHQLLMKKLIRFCFPDTASYTRMQNSFCVEGK